MPTYEEMKKIKGFSTIGAEIRGMSNMVMNETFSNTGRYRIGKFYNSDMEEIDEIEFKFHKVKKYTIAGDQVEYHVQFRPGVCPEIIYDKSYDQKHRLNYYIDIYDDNTHQYDKWLIVGKDSDDFDRYVVLKCNWTFEWIDHNRVYHKCLGCVRDRNSYNSGKLYMPPLIVILK